MKTLFVGRFTRKVGVPILLGLAWLMVGSQASAAFILFNTGVDSSGSALPLGSADPHWSIVAGPGITSSVPAVVVNDQLTSIYVQDTDSRWVWADADGAAALSSPYTFRLTFDLTGFDPATAQITGQWAADNDGQILLNGSSTGIGSGTLALLNMQQINFRAFHSFTLTSGFMPGVNHLDFVITDVGSVGGLNVADLAGTASVVPVVPAPPTGLLAAISLLSMLPLWWCRRKHLGGRAGGALGVHWQRENRSEV